MALRSIAMALLLVMLAAAGPANAQRVALPLPRLLSTMPMGGQAGTEVEVAITTEHVIEPVGLYFSDPRIDASPVVDDDGNVVADRYVVSIAADCPRGIYEARVMSRLGLSASRVFSVDTLGELAPAEPHTSLETAVQLSVDSICNAQMPARAINHYRFAAEAGQRYLIHCATGSIDSKLDAVLILADGAGRDLEVQRSGGVIDFTAPEDGDYVIKAHELTYKGGPEYFYRLSLRQLEADAPQPAFPSTRGVSAFSWPPAGLPDEAPLQEIEPNDSAEQAQPISLPCDIAGNFATAADVDTFEFTAEAGQQWWIEVASQRLGRPTNVAVLVQYVDDSGDSEQLTDVLQLDEIPSPVKPSSNGYSYDGPPYDSGSPDVLGKLQIEHSGRYRLQITDLFGGTRADPANVYRLVIRQSQPDFALVAWGLHMQLRNGDRNALSKPIALRGGGTMALEVVALRRDGFTGEIQLSMDDLPDGVTAQGVSIGAGSNRGIMLVTAHPDAPQGFSMATFQGQATIDGQQVTRPVRMASMAWPVGDAWQEIPKPRLESDVAVSVSGHDMAPITIAADGANVIEAEAQASVTIPLVHHRRGEFSGSVLQLRTFGHGFEANPRFDITLTDDSSAAVLDLSKLKPPPGDHVIAFYGSAVVKHVYEPDKPPQDTAEIVVTEPITLRVLAGETK